MVLILIERMRRGILGSDSCKPSGLCKVIAGSRYPVSSSFLASNVAYRHGTLVRVRMLRVGFANGGEYIADVWP